MKRAIPIALIVVFMSGTVTSDAWADAQVYLTVTIGGGVVIGVVGVFIHLVFVQRIAEQQKQEEQQMVVAGPSQSNLNLNVTDQARPQISDRNLYLERFNPSSENRRVVHPDLEVNFFTFRW